MIDDNEIIRERNENRNRGGERTHWREALSRAMYRS
jgi:hypothetical protein